MIAVNDPVPAPTIRDAAQVDDIAVVRELDPQNVRLARSRISREPRPGSEPGFLRADRRAPPIPSRRVSGGGVGWLAFCVPVAECLGTEAPPVLAKNSLARAGVSVIRVDPRKSTPAKRSPLSYPPWGSFRQHHYRYPEDSREEPRQRSDLDPRCHHRGDCTCRRTANERSNDGADDHMLWELFAFSHETLAHKRLLTRRWSWLLTQLP
jgi:hypothetical protein